MYFCYCGRKLPILPKDRREIGNVYYCKCGRIWLWKIRSRIWIFAGYRK